MKKIIVSIFLSIQMFLLFSQEIDKEQEKYITDFISCVKSGNKQKLAEKVSYPLRRVYPIPDIRNEQEFIERYNEIFDDKLSRIIAISAPKKDWSAIGWRGITLHDGEVWIDYDGKLLYVNYQSEIERNKQSNLIEKERNELYESLRNFKRPILYMETATHRIRIDEMENLSYRASAWKIAQKISEKPDIIILDGKYYPDGSGGNHHYEFIQDKLKYVCYIYVLGDGVNPDTSINIYANEKEIVSQKVNQLKR